MQKLERPVEWPIDVTVAGGKINVAPDPCRLSAARRDEVIWTCHDGELTVEFDTMDGCPFDRAKLPRNHPRHASRRSGPPVSGEQRSYKYTVKVLLEGASAPIELDPEVVIDDNTPPPQRITAAARKPVARAKRKAAKKKATRKKVARRAAKKRVVRKAVRRKLAKKVAKKRAVRRIVRRKAARKVARKRAVRRVVRRKVAKKAARRRRSGR